ncbi:penicillin-binding protein 2 [uncultured Ferrovibrio sp.]|jgi:penicillin-binding protein 2|uniref:penicillin-binding protein 2 n=1 Tax=uncultured Ferrovibrio sp. TaxID=1576913 RepID=UPI0026216462|nr:penicillin-binding protein 2 [uncultured Ferrovibrio sp.]
MAINRRDNDLKAVFTRRALLLGTAQLALFGVLAGRLYYLQVLESDKYTLLAEENRINMRLLPPRRGRILDRYGIELASNRRNYRVLIVAEQARDVDATLAALAELIQVDEVQKQRVKREIERRRKFVPVVVAENLSWDDFAKVNLHSPDLPGVQLDVGETRDYPFGPDFAHVVGYVGAVSEGDQGDDPLLELPGFRIGKSGVEKVYDERLRGRAGHSQMEVNAYGRAIRELTRYDGQPGDDVVLTIDAELQRMAMQRFGEESGAAVVMDVHTGDILALVSNPGFDPNWFNVGITQAQWRQLNSDKFKPLINKAVQGTYPPGSTFKMAVAIAALEAGAVDASTRVFCPGHMEFGNTRFHCWKKGGHGAMNVVSALEESCDIFFYEAARRIGVDKIAEVAKKLGLGAVTGLDVTGERRGLIPTREWKRAALNQPWHPGENLITGIGQGYVLATPLQLAVMAARIANGGYAVEPRIVRPSATFGPEPDQRLAKDRWPSLGIKREYLELAQEGMIRVTSPPRGTAQRARITLAEYAMAGKTGSAQVRRISRLERETRVRKNEEKPWEERDHALFVAYAPIHAPRYACAVIVEHGGGGSTAAAPIARDIMLEVQKRDPSRKERSVPGVTTAAAELKGGG